MARREERTAAADPDRADVGPLGQLEETAVLGEEGVAVSFAAGVEEVRAEHAARILGFVRMATGEGETPTLVLQPPLSTCPDQAVHAAGAAAEPAAAAHRSREPPIAGGPSVDRRQQNEHLLLMRGELQARFVLEPLTQEVLAKPPPPRMNCVLCGPAHFILDRTRQWVHLPKEMFMIMPPPPLLNCPTPPCGLAHFNLDRTHR